MTVDLNDFERQIDCLYKSERYSARDNGAVLRYSRVGKRPRPSDEKWTFGTPNKQKGYFYLSSEPVHRIVATAFHGQQPSEKHVVDHIDTNKKNNRPENLRWVTKLENIILIPVTLSRIIYKYGSLENFLANPAMPLNGKLDQNYDWMRTVSKAESENTRKNLLKWAKEGKVPAGGQLGEWIYQNLDSHTDSGDKEDMLSESLTRNAIQKNWKTPSLFPCCPLTITTNPLSTYLANLKTGAIFSQNKYITSIVQAFALSSDQTRLCVMCQNSDLNALKPYSLAQVSFENDLYVHSNLGSFFEKDGAEKYFTLAQGLEWKGGDTFDDNS